MSEFLGTTEADDAIVLQRDSGAFESRHFNIGFREASFKSRAEALQVGFDLGYALECRLAFIRELDGIDHEPVAGEEEARSFCKDLNSLIAYYQTDLENRTFPFLENQNLKDALIDTLK